MWSVWSIDSGESPFQSDSQDPVTYHCIAEALKFSYTRQKKLSFIWRSFICIVKEELDMMIAEFCLL